MKTRVYFNLHKRCLSLQEKVNGEWKVVRYAEEVILTNAEFKVSEAGRQRVLKEKKKNVHAVVVGECNGRRDYPTTKKQIFYNPYKAPTFLDAESNPVHHADLVVIKGNKKGYKNFAKNLDSQHLNT